MSECQVCRSAGVEIQGNDGGGIGDDCFELNGVDERFRERGDFERGVVEAPDVIPDCDPMLAQSFTQL
jgi:hypothetical protein